MGVTTTSLETVDGGFPNIDLEAVVGLKGMLVLRFLWRLRRELAKHFVWSPDDMFLWQNTQDELIFKKFKGSSFVTLRFWLQFAILESNSDATWFFSDS